MAAASAAVVVGPAEWPAATGMDPVAVVEEECSYKALLMLILTIV